MDEKTQPLPSGPSPARSTNQETQLGVKPAAAPAKPAAAATPNPPAAPAATAEARLPTANMIAAMVKSGKNVSDLIFSPGRPPQMEIDGELVAVKFSGLEMLTPAQTAQIAADLMDSNQLAAQKLKDDGSCDISYGLQQVGRFRVNIFSQRGSCAIVMRVIPYSTPDFATLGLPDVLDEVVHLKNGIVLVTGPTGSGKSSTLAAVIDRINTLKAVHIITIEDPIEFLHRHKKGTVHQRELHSDTPNFALALRAALRQAPKVILVGEMRDRETMEIALEAAETGHLVLSTLHTIDASKTVERILGVFPLNEQNAIRNRLSKSFRFFISQRLLPKKDGKGRLPVFEILKSSMRTREYIEKGEGDGKSLVDAMRDGGEDGMRHFDGELERLVRAGEIDIEAALLYSSNAGNLRLSLSDLFDEARTAERRGRGRATGTTGAPEFTKY